MLTLQEEEIAKEHTTTKVIDDTNLYLVAAQTYITWKLFESFLLVKHFPLETNEQIETAKTLKSNLSRTQKLIFENRSSLMQQYLFVQDDLNDRARGVCRIALGGPDYDLGIPYFRSQKQKRK